MTNSVAALSGLQAYEALDKLYERLDELGNKSGSEYRTGKSADEKRAADILKEALEMKREFPQRIYDLAVMLS